MTKTYRLLPYIISPTPKGLFFQNTQTTAVIKQPAVVDFLTRMDRGREQLLTGEDCPNEQLLAFLLSNRILIEINQEAVRYNRVWIASNCTVFASVGQSLMSTLPDLPRERIAHIALGSLADTDLQADDVVIALLNPLNIADFKQLVSTLSQSDCLQKLCFYYNAHLYISNLHRPSWKNPCPLCFFSNIATQLRSDNRVQSVNFQRIVDILYLDKLPIETAFVPEPYHYAQLVAMLIEQLNSANDTNYLANHVTSIDINTGLTNTDTACHWELCNCYE